MSRMPRIIERVARFFGLQSWFRLLFLCVLVGVVSGLGALLFDSVLHLLEKQLLNEWLFNTANPDYQYWPLVVVPAVGGGLAGLIAVWFAPEATGHGTDAVIRAFHKEKGAIRARVPLVKGICSILTIGSGGSAGKEGPIAQIGAGFGSTLATLLKLSVRDRRILMLAGVAGGIGAIFKAPLGGALFAAEVLYREPDFESDAVIPGVISSVTAYSVFTAIEGHTRLLDFKDPQGVVLPPLTFPSPHGSAASELFHYAMLSLLCALVAFLFVKGIRWIESLFKRLPVPRLIKPAMGGALLGAFAVGLMLATGALATDMEVGTSQPHHIMAGGQRYLQTVINSALDTTVYDPQSSLKLAGFLAAVVLAKIVATGLTIGSGGSGGLLFPALFLGGTTGAAYAKLCRALNEAGWMHSFFSLTPNARAGMILVGMGGVFAACTKTPIASLVMVSEITGSYGLAVPLMMTCASAYVLSRSFALNEEQVPSVAESPAHRGDFQVNVLADIRVADAISNTTPEMFLAETPFTKVLQRIKSSSATVFPIVDANLCLLGIFSLGDIRQIMNEQLVGTLIVAGDLGTTNVISVTMDTDLNEALRLFTMRNLDEIPVVESEKKISDASRATISSAIRRPRGPAGTLKVIGMLSRRDVITAYHQRINEMQRAEAQDNSGSRVFVDALQSVPHVLASPLIIPKSEMVANTAADPGAELLNEPPETPSDGSGKIG